MAGPTTIVAYTDGKELSHSECQLGSSVTEANTELAGLEAGIRLAQSLLVHCQTWSEIRLLRADPSAVMVITNYGPHLGEPSSLAFRQTADMLLSLHRTLKILIMWAPKLGA